MSMPSMRIAPDCGSWKRSSSENTVLLPAPDGPDQRDGFARAHAQGEVVQRRQVRALRVVEGHVVEGDVAPQRLRQRLRMRGRA